MANFFPSTSAPENLDQLEVMEEERAWREVRRYFSDLEWNTAPEFRKNYWKNELVNYDTFIRAGEETQSFTKKQQPMKAKAALDNSIVAENIKRSFNNIPETTGVLRCLVRPLPSMPRRLDLTRVSHHLTIGALDETEKV
ncbi:unnamed protein product [Cyprideis torosa]|uniref:Uncharacterized protein n=1 Tax=Cyprideis torosa TaxID=163714 RepID=A0A7R8ZXN6_9CRUS|nr:unnamed protein product [Cyprideis torosa]CAG0907114.1 unnamed protein product [Cyprideis torosa]